MLIFLLILRCLAIGLVWWRMWDSRYTYIWWFFFFYIWILCIFDFASFNNFILNFLCQIFVFRFFLAFLCFYLLLFLWLWRRRIWWRITLHRRCWFFTHFLLWLRLRSRFDLLYWFHLQFLFFRVNWNLNNGLDLVIDRYLILKASFISSLFLLNSLFFLFIIWYIFGLRCLRLKDKIIR